MYQKYRMCASAPAGAFSELKIATPDSSSTGNVVFYISNIEIAGPQRSPSLIGGYLPPHERQNPRGLPSLMGWLPPNGHHSGGASSPIWGDPPWETEVHGYYVAKKSIGKKTYWQWEARGNSPYKKSKTVIKDNSFIGSNSSLVAPVTIEQDSIVGAGSVITKNVKKKSLALTRSLQIEVQNYKRKKK